MVQTYLRPGELPSADVLYVEEAAWRQHSAAAKSRTASAYRLEREYRRLVVYRAADGIP
jgi:hypothetical protein